MGKNSTPADGTLEYANMSYNNAIDQMQLKYNHADKLIQDGRNQFVADVYPYVDASKQSLGELQQFLGLATTNGTNQAALTGQQISEKLADTPGYKFQVEQGNQALQRTAAAGGMLSSGNALLAAQKFGSDLAQNTYQSHVSNLMNFNNSMAPMVSANLANISDTATQRAQLFANNGNQLQQAYTQKGNSNMAYAMQTSAQNAQAANNQQVSNGAMAGLQAGYLRGAF